MSCNDAEQPLPRPADDACQYEGTRHELSPDVSSPGLSSLLSFRSKQR
jgi:hypothetical protein